MTLRPWQETCLAQVLEWYEHEDHFMCLATPGAGKTILAANVAKKLIEAGQIDFVLGMSPSAEVAQSTTSTFRNVLGRRFDGRIGAVGAAYTYQSLLHFKPDFWEIFDRHRVLVVLDEIHHCSGSDYQNANAWGLEILTNIQSRASFTLALSGTPWRSDDLPIVLAKYSDPEGKIRCNFEYGLRQAIADGVCRIPKIVLIDHGEVHISGQDIEPRSFASLSELMKSRAVRYEDLIQDIEAIRFMLGRGCKKLAEIKRNNPKAAGFVVASSVKHAQLIADELASTFRQSVRVVTYKNPDASIEIEEFRNSCNDWIVSVGMISEGTDIPRLQICCHLSVIKTELHYRQVLGRILRMTHDKDRTGWLFTFAETTLVQYAHDLKYEIPEARVISLKATFQPAAVEHVGNNCPSAAQMPICVGGRNDMNRDLPAIAFTSSSNTEAVFRPQLNFVGQFREQVISTFTSPF